ncbi:hypothetical protein ACEWY4_025043 [Coilia grayii]|uniref:P2X purinoreceptor 7 intracellular domain-containing protein n=1 Tax=Coilia grayii TaxID=363190 RepID=A0ABD1IXF9_9TELE
MATNTEDYITDEDDDLDYQDPRPYLFEPVFTEEELQALGLGREDAPTIQSHLDERRRANMNWWWECGVCQPMPTEMECLCCAEWNKILPSMESNAPEEEGGRSCVTATEDFSAMIHPAVLNFFFRRDKVNWKRDNTPSGPNGQLSSEQYRLVSYRVVLEWALKGETLGKGNRTPLPSCVVAAIRQKFPSESGVYVGFQEVQEAIDIVL